MSAKYPGGVLYYTRATASISVSFPEKDVCCQNCPLLAGEYLLHRSRCAVTGEIIPDPEYMTGGLCPLEIKEES